MDFSQTEEQKMIVSSAAKFGQQMRDRHRDSEKEGVGDDLTRAYGELGLLTLDWPEKFSGAGLGRLTKIMALEELAWGDAAATLALDRASIVCSPLLALDAVAPRVYEAVKSGGPSFSPAFVVDTDERLELKAGRAIGTLPYLPQNGCSVLWILRGRTLACVSSGLDAKPTGVGALDAAGGSALEIDGSVDWSVEFPETDALRLSGLWRLYLAAILVGLSRAAGEYARQYCLDRVTFGKKVAHHQGVTFSLVDMLIAVDGARLLCHEAAHFADGGKSSPLDGQSGFLQAAECALFVTNYAVQFLASAGYVRDYPVEKWMREARAITLLAGGIDGAQMDANRALILSQEAA